MRDSEIRELLRRTYLKKYINDANSKIVEELRLSPTGAQIDIAVINGAFHAYEIKGASDSLSRLSGQIDSYSKIFDYVTVITEEKFREKVLDLVPGWIGVSVCSNSGLQVVRKAKRNKNIEGFYIAMLLWRGELLTILNDRSINHSSGCRNWTLCETLASNMSPRLLSSKVRAALKNRTNWKGY